MLTRILAACVGLPLLLAVVLFLPPVATAILFALACGVAAYEMLWRTGILKHRRILVYTIVAEHEANLREGKLAIGTPIAKALLGHKKGDRVDVEVPAGTIHFEILDINI